MDHGDSQHIQFVQSPTERTPLLISAPSVDSINNPLQEKLQIKKQKLVYSSITLADIFQKSVHTTFITSFLLFTYTDLDLDYKNSLASYYLFGLTSGLFASFLNMNIEYILSRQNAIVGGFIIYTFGLGGMSGFTSHVDSSSPASYQYFVLIPLFFICIGEGMCKSCISDFTQLQFDEKFMPEKLSAYLKRLFWIGHIGAFIMILFLLGIVEFTAFELAYGLGCICLLAGLLCFMSGWNNFEVYGRNASSVVYLVKMIVDDAKEKKDLHMEQRKRASSFHESYEGRDFVGHWMDYAKHSFGGSFTDNLVDQTKAFFKISLLFLSFIPYWVANAQVYGTFMFQDFHLQRKIGNLRVPVTWMALFHVASVLIFVQVLDKLIVPFCRRKGIIFTSHWKISIGMVFGIVAMICAAFVELVAHTSDINNQGEELIHQIGNKNLTFTDVHVLWTVPQFCFLGISEVLIGLTG
eukprot:TCONS_00018068-protein